MLTEFRQLCDHLIWADQRLLTAMQSPLLSPAAVREMAHIVGADAIWLARLTGQPSPVPVWPETDLAGLTTMLARTHDAFRDYLDTLPEAALSETVRYSNSTGTAFANSVRDILRHVLMHAHYHRGKVNLLLRQAGITPAPVDYIIFLREVTAPSTST
jgi:uncharacterized damage-inducible protein DinB